MNTLQGSWQELRPINIARSHPAVSLHGNAIYIFGGGGPNFQSLNSSVRFDIAENNWVPLRDMPTKRSGTAAFTVGDKIYVVGGGFKKPDGNFQFLTTVEIYDIPSDTWATGPSLNQPHDYPAAAMLDNQLYIFGGHHPDACLGGPRTDPGFDYSERLTPGDSAWKELAPLPTPRFAAAAVNIGKRLLVCGGVAFRPEGFNNFDFFETYDPALNSWSKESELKLPWPAAGQGLCVLGDRLYFMGGYSTDSIHPRAAVYDIGQRQWSRLPDMPIPRAAMGVATHNNSVFLIGGWANDGRTPVNSCVVFTPA